MMSSEKQNKPTPPKWPDKLLERFCAPHLLEEVLGDLHERYALRVKRVGEERAKKQYWQEVLAYVRPSIFKRQSFHHTKPIPMDMFKNYFTIAYRNLLRYFSYTAINIVGLSIGLTACLFIVLYIFHELSFDRYHTQADRIYRVETQKINPEGVSSYAGIPWGVAPALRHDFSEVEEVTTLTMSNNQLISIPDGKINAVQFQESIAFADHAFFDVFDYTWIAGSSQTALRAPNTVLLTESYAYKLFGYTPKVNLSEIIGKVIRLNHELDLQVIGVLKDYPANTSFPFNVIASLSTLKDIDYSDWGGWSDNNQAYVVLAPGTSPQQVERQFPAMLEKYKGAEASKERGHRLLPLKEVHNEYNYSGRQGDPNTLYALGMIGLFLLVIACINFINLATVQATRRAKEVGVRKVLGSSRSQLAGQFMSEITLVTCIAFLLATMMVILLLPYASRLTGVELPVSALLKPGFFAFVVILFVVVSLLAGLYPAWVLSGFRPVAALKSKITRPKNNGFTLKQGMVTLQFAISQVLMIGIMVIASQMYLFRHADLGFNSEAMITVALPDNTQEKLQTMRNQWLQYAGVKEVSFSFNSASAESNFMGELLHKTDSSEVSIRTQFKFADAHFLDTYGIALLAGKPLEEGDTTGQILVNEVFTRSMGLQHPEEAIGEFIDNSDPRFTIAGVVKDFHVNSLHQNIDPTIIAIAPQYYRQASIKMQVAGNAGAAFRQTLQHIQEVWTANYPDQLFSYQFLDEALAQAYEKENQTVQLLHLFAGIAIFISCLGLYGLVSFMAVQRTKEVGVRKVLGASVMHIVGLFSREFVGLVALAFIVAAPAGYYLMSQWLQDFAYRVDIQWWMFAAVGGLALFIALLTISFQSIKAALANPVDSLRNE